MSDEGERGEPRVGEGGDWWSELYDPEAPDTGRSPAGDTIDDRFAAARAVGASGPGEATDQPPASDDGPDEPDGPRAPAPSAADDGQRPRGAAREPEHTGGTVRRRTVRDVLGYGGRQGRAPGAVEPSRGWLAPSEPGVLPGTDPAALGDVVPDTVLDGARHGSLVLRGVSGRGGSARQRGEPRGDALLTACFGTGAGALLFLAVGVGAGTAPAGRRAAHEVCRSLGEAVGRSRARLVEDLSSARRAALSSGLQRLTDRCYGRLRAQAAALGLEPDAYTADLRCLLLPADPACRLRVAFGAGGGGLFRLRAGSWTDLEPGEESETARSGGGPASRRPLQAHLPDPRVPEGGGTAPATPRFRFRAVTADPGDTLLLCSTGFAVPLRADPEFADTLASNWAGPADPPDLATFLTDVQHPAPAYGDDRTAVAVWDAGPGLP